MKKLGFTLMISLVLLGISSLGAYADEVANSSFIVRAGFMTPSGTNLQGQSSFSAGAEWEWNYKGQHDQAWSVSADFTNVRRSDGNSSTTLPALINYKWYGGMGGDTRGFFGVGLGGFLGDFGGFAYGAQAGLQFSHNWLITVRYVGDGGNSKVGATASTLTSIFGADLGFRF